MKTKLFITPLFIILFTVANAQKLTPEQQYRKETRVEPFTSEERDNLQMWFYERVNEMNITEKVRDEYYSIILYYTVKMKRLDDKDIGNTEEEIDKKFADLLERQNAEVKILLPEKLYNMHLENFSELLEFVNNKKELQKKELQKN